jgi:predicted amidohydrolase YtcJ
MLLLGEKYLMSRRMFMLGTTSFVAAVSMGKVTHAQSSHTQAKGHSSLLAGDRPADSIYLNGTVITMNDDQPQAEAIAVKNGMIVAVGDRQTIQAWQGKNTKIFDLQGKTLLPGFIDAHGHLFNLGITSAVAFLNPPPDGTVDSIDKLVASLKAQIDKPSTKALGWVIGNGYDDPLLAEERHPNRDDLDRVSTELPVIAIHSSGHLAALNSKGLEIVGINAQTENPPGGVIQRQKGSNEPNGVLEENAFWMVLAKLGTPSPEQVIITIAKSCEIYASYGYTTAQEGRATPGVVEALKAVANTGKLPLDVAIYGDYLTAPKLHEDTWVKEHYHNRLRLAGAKMNFDGSPQGKTAWLTEPYYIPPEGQTADYKGYASIEDDVAIERVMTAFANNFQIMVHCNGDAAIDQLIMAVRKATEKYGKGDRRPVIIHCQIVREDQLDAMKELGIFPAMFPAHTYYWGDWHRDSVLGVERASRISPTQSVLQRGMMFTTHHDAPVILPNSMRVLWATVNRRTRSGAILGEDQRVSVMDGLKAMTLWAAYQHFEEKTKGSLEVGKLADFVILSDNPLTVDPMNITDISILETIKEGVTIYRRDKND